MDLKSNEKEYNRMRDEVLAWLAENVPQPRIRHILGVEQMATDLAVAHHLNSRQAAAAGLLHDLAKYFPGDRLLEMAGAEGLEIDPILRENPHLLHADVSAIVARDRFGVRDETILEAVRNHTLGKPNMDALSCVVFLADSLEPGRGDTPQLEYLRSLSYQSLLQAVWATCDASIQHMLKTHRTIHPRTLETRNWSMSAAKKEKQRQKVREKSA
ncbi:bis(5'-nucleosyl)-tetraphosphatase (symmetrical) YqeK [Geitlerinema sp. PCC 9228]|uniref:bis(5'-nucleosyl)-tetraphosphatase (symmetrical) YqeK n=1 Tax=Geitlerinema sp. PCC 9228 TaxID=111611 RepID=UPI0031BA5C8B